MVRRGEIYWVEAGSPNGAHPHVVVQDDLFNDSRIRSVVVCALTSNVQRASEPGNVLLDIGEGELPKQSVVVVSQIESVDRTTLGERIGSLSPARVEQILAGLRFQQRAFHARQASPQRARFDLPDDVAYLNCAYMSPLAHEVVLAGIHGLARKTQPWRVQPHEFFDSSEQLRRLFAQLVHGDADGVALIPSVSYGMSLAAKILPFARGQRVLTLAEQFPSNVYPWRALAERKDGQHEIVARPHDDDWTSALLERIDNDVAIVAIPHCHWTDGGLLDLPAIRAACDRVGAALCIDATQSLGALPLDVQQVRPDVLCAAGYKWLMGPYSLGYMYIAQKWRNAEPLEQNWITRAGAEDFSRLVLGSYEYAPGARRFDVGERSNFALVPAAIAALQMVLEWNPAHVQAALAQRNEQIAERARELGFHTVPSDRRAGHYLGLRAQSAIPATLTQRLAAAHVFVSVRGAAIRVTPHLYNTDRDIDRLFTALQHP